ncbi:glycosyltransferase family 2 protein [Candidatus Thiodictyon syntrophicum]|jgi:cellulose synthase/poly-beta-1,6-N-acetylglucosamine synthase-like glycosyltransferase|uniref:Glycosyl transferase n=1 Tax=Candidatus Thiodictyon syntrophicum TaxID=1166950 RepID=A0A2K8UA50_9GAMM|nr:glycosyltransferase family 2 protein [Candidatus Thiodictyon syntrophicum]AUB82460.1 glycosyl transferase [Candidatus Thiodictyon syntrophicum]
MSHTILTILTLLAGVLVVYHHLGYPLLLKWLADRRKETPPVALPQRAYRPAAADAERPVVAIVIPAYNEEDHVADKLRNLAMLDYPSDRLRVVLACDGCTDATAERAWRVAREPECRDLSLQILEFRQNRGKVAVLNHVIPNIDCDLLALSDVSALVSVDALLVAADCFQDPKVGVITGSYRLFGSYHPQVGHQSGESLYWQYQSEIKRKEGALGSTMGVHGAFYMIRRDLFEPLDLDVINDDFMLPMRIVARGYRALYEPRILALELESAGLDLDRSRRRRIAAGNMQQLVRLGALLRPSLRGVAFVFASGKALRALMPFLLLLLLGGSAVLAVHSRVFLALFLVQAVVYLTAFVVQRIGPARVVWPLQALHYLVQGHLVGLVGSVRYLLGLERGRWRRANLALATPAPETPGT